MQLANIEPQINAAGAEIVAVSVDSPGRNQGMRQHWHLPFPIASDPGGVDFLQPLGLWNPNERGGIGWPAVLVFDPFGTEVLRRRSRDYAERASSDADVLEALGSLDLPPLDLASTGAGDAEVEDNPAAFRPDAFGAYFRGILSGVAGLSSRLSLDADRAEATSMVRMASGFLEAWKLRRQST